jgi:hypothetical protein
VRAPGAVAPAAADDPRERHLGVRRAVHDPEQRHGQQRLEARAPDPVLERGFRHRRHAGLQQQPQHGEEHRQRPHGQLVALARREAGGSVCHPLLDLVAGDGRAAGRARDLVREGGLAGSGWPADHDQRGERGVINHSFGPA